MQMLNDSLQRRMLHQGAFWLGGGAIGANSILPEATRQLVLQQQPPSHGQPQQLGGGGDSGVPRQNLSRPPVLHSLNNSPNFPQSLSNQSHHHHQILSMQLPNTTSGRVRAPISPVPSGIPLHEALQRNMPPPGNSLPIQPSLFRNQPSLHNKSLTGPANTPPSQQVT